MLQNAHRYRQNAAYMLIKAFEAPSPTLRDAWIAVAIHYQGLAHEIEARAPRPVELQ